MTSITDPAAGSETAEAARTAVRSSSASPTPDRRRRRHLIDWSAYLVLLPWFAGMLFTVIPFGASLVLAFTDYDLLNAPKFIGMQNFTEIFRDERVHKSLAVTFIYCLVSVPTSLAAALGVALMLNKGLRGLPIFRAIYYLPSLLGSSVAVVMLWRQVFSTRGIVNTALGWFGIQGPSWTSDPHTALSVLILLHIWTFGAPMVIFLAALRQVPVMYYEAAAVDGASRWRQFRSITLPLISPIIFFNLVLATIGAMQSFTQSFVMSNGTGGPADSTLFYNLYLYVQGFSRFHMGYASALAWVLLLIIAALTAINFLAQRYWVFYEN